MSELSVEMVGSIVEGPMTLEDAERGGIKLVAFAGTVAVLYEYQVHPSFVNLQPGQRVCCDYPSIGFPQVRLQGETDGA